MVNDQGNMQVRVWPDATLQADGTEDSLLQHKRGDLGKLRRVLVRLQQLLVPEPGASFRLLRPPPRWINGHDTDELRQSPSREFGLAARLWCLGQAKIQAVG